MPKNKQKQQQTEGKQRHWKVVEDEEEDTQLLNIKDGDKVLEKDVRLRKTHLVTKRKQSLGKKETFFGSTSVMYSMTLLLRTLNS